MKISKERVSHMHAVAEYMYDNAKYYGLEKDKEQLYVIGLIHDVGSVRDKTNHEENSADILSKVRLDDKYIDIIKYHGSSPEQYCIDHNIDEGEIPAELLLLWEADLHIGPNGEYMSFDERIQEMIQRHREILEKDYNYFDPHVLLCVNDDNMVTDIQYHSTYGDIAKSVVRLLRSRGRT